VHLSALAHLLANVNQFPGKPGRKLGRKQGRKETSWEVGKEVSQKLASSVVLVHSPQLLLDNYCCVVIKMVVT
jgi:hypothetical protein